MENKHNLKCDYCEKTETCKGSHPEGCFLENQIINYEKNLAIQFGRWLLKNAISEDKGEGLCWYFDNKPYNNKELFNLWDENFRSV